MMRTREPILTRGRDHWDRVNLPRAEFHDRLDRVRESMRTEELDALVVYGTGDRDGAIAYLSNLVHKVPGFPLALVVTLDAAVVVNQRSSRTRPVVERSTWIDDVRFTRALWTELDDILTDLVGTDAEIAFVGSAAMSHADRTDLDTLQSSRSIAVLDRFLDPLRLTKSDRELDQLRRAGRLAGAVERVIPEVLEPPVGERRFEAEIDRMARLKGAQDVRLLLSNPGQTEDDLRPPEGRTVIRSGPISVYLAVRFEGYWSALARTLPVEDADSVARDDVLADYESVLESITPGEDGAAVRTRIRDLGYEVARGYPLVSGIGLELDEPMAMDGEGSPASGRFEPRTAVEVTMPVRPSESALQVFGDTILVTEDGIEIVTR